MTIEQSICAFNELGQLFDYITDKKMKISNELELKFSNLDSSIDLILREIEAYNNWFTQDNILFALRSWSEILTTDKLFSWIKPYEFNNTNKTVGIIMAGNLPLVGFHDLLCVVLSGNKAFVKLSSKDCKLMDFVIKYLYSIDKRFEERIKIVDRLNKFDAVIATGSNNTARYFEQYFSKVPHIIRKNRTSIAVINGTETEEEMKKMGEDIFRYFGLGCRNVTKIYFKSEDLIPYFFESIIDWGNIVINHPKYANNYDYNRAIYLLSKDVFLDNNFVLLKKDNNLHSPIAVINYEIYSEIDEVKSFLKENDNQIQCVVGNELKDNLNYVDFGCTQKPSLTDYADNIDTMEFLSSVK